MKKNKEVSIELKKISPHLTESEFQTKLESLTHAESDLHDFNIPDGYFDRMTASVMQQVQLMPQPTFAPTHPTFLQRVISFFTTASPTKKYALTLVSLLVLVTGTTLIINQSNPSIQPAITTTEEAHIEAAHQYILNNIDDLDEEQLLELSESKPLANELPNNTDHYKDIPAEDVEKYLKEQDL